MHRRLVYIYLLNVPSFSSRYFNKIKRTSSLGRLLALSLEILLTISAQFMLTPTCIITLFIHLQYETGITYPKKLKSSSVATFKYQLNKDTQRRAPPKFFSAGSRLGQILHARIRMACGSLNSDLCRKNIVPSPSCACGGFESAYHFFFICPNYNVTRERYLEALLRNHTTH